MLEDLSEKGKDGKPLTEFNEDLKNTEIKLSEENKSIFQDKLEELRETKIDIPFKKLSKKHFNKVENLTPAHLKGVILLLKD